MPAATKAKRRRHISYSQINEFLMCPKKYHLHRRLKLPPDFMPSSLAFGIAMHEAIALFHQKRLAGFRAGEEEILATFQKHWDSQKLPIKYKKNEGEDVLREKARGMLGKYLESPHVCGTPLAVEEKVHAVLRDDLPPILGRIDLLEKTEDGGQILTDFKTASSRRAQDEGQLLLYREALRMAGYTGADTIQLRCVVLLKTKEPDIDIQTFDADDGKLKKLMSLYRETWDAIQNGVSHPTPGWQCSSCQWAHLCSQG